MKLKGLLSAILGASVLFGTTAAAYASDDTAAVSETGKIDFSAPSKGLNVAEHSRDTIRQYINGHPFDMTRNAEYAREPQTYVPYSDAGKLSDTDLVEARNALNVMRFVAGVGIQDVTLCPYATYYAQCGALANFKNGYISHNPAFIQGIDGTTWAYSKLGAQNSNVSSGYTNAAHSVVLGYLYDTNDNNIGLLGHRRWCLNPSMYLTGFGQVGNFGAMWTTDKQLTNADNSGICWPAQNMPLEYFPDDTAWSVSMCEDVPADSVKVTLTRKSDLRTWEFSAEHADGYFTVSNDKSVPLDGCIIFRPDDAGGYNHGDVFNVTIEGLDKEVSYNVNFFDLDGDDSVFEEPAEETEPDYSSDSEDENNAPEDTENEEDDAPDEPNNSDNAVKIENDESDTADEPAAKREFISEDTDIRITADPDVFPADTTFKAQPIGSGCTATRYTCDLSFMCGGKAIQPNGCVNVSIPVPNGFSNYKVLRVYHVENGCCSFVPSDMINGRICFSASSFSPYIITTEELDGQSVEPSESSANDDTDAETENNVNTNDGNTDTNTGSTSENSIADDKANSDDSTKEETPKTNSDYVSSAEMETKSSGNPNTGIGAAAIPAAVAACAAVMIFKRNKEQFFK